MKEAKGYSWWIILGLFLIGLTVFSIQFYDRYLFLRAIILFFSLGYILVKCSRKTLVINKITILLFLLFLFELTSALWSYSITNTIKYSYLAVLSFLLFLVFFQEEHRKNLWFLSRLNAFLLVVYFLVAVNQIISKGWEPYGIHSLSSHKNLYAGLLLLSLPLTIISIKHFQKRGIILILKVLLIFTLLFIVVLQSRAVYLSLIIFFLLAAVFGVHYYYYAIDKKKFKSILKQFVFVPAFVVPGCLIYLGVIGPDTREDFIDKINVINYFSKPDSITVSEVTENNYQSIEIRKVFWKSTLQLISDRPILGVGKGNWKIAAGKYSTPLLPDRLTQNNSYSHTHNDFLQQFAETGIIGLLLFIVPILAIVVFGYKSLISNKFNFEIFILTIGITAFLVYAFFDFPFQNVELRILFYFQLLLLYQLLVNNRTIISKQVLSLNKKVLYLPIVLICIISSVQLRSDFHALKTVQFEGIDNYKKAFHHLGKAKNQIYNITPTNFPLDYIGGRMYLETGDLEKAFPLVESALKVNPFEFRALNDYGMLLNNQGRQGEALEVFQKASNLAPYFEDPIFNMAAIYYYEKRYDRALELLEPLTDSQKKRDYIMQIKTEMMSL